MNALTLPLSPQEINDIERELERLFAMHDRPLTADKKASFVAAIRTFGFPFGAIVAGIRKLCEQDISRVRLFDIKEAARSFITYDTGFDACRFCDVTGFVYMRRDDGYSFAFPCTCPRGQHLSEVQHLTRWNGLKTQNIRDHSFTLIKPAPEAFNIPEMNEELAAACAVVGGEVVGTVPEFSE